jgi:hypothetical protein
MYSHLTADVAATRTDDDIMRAASRRSRSASDGDAGTRRRRSVVPWPRRSRADGASVDCYPRAARA